MIKEKHATVSKKRSSGWSAFILVSIIVVTIVGIYWWKGEQQLKVYNAHSWKQTQAYFETSYQYQKNDTIYYNGSEQKVYNTLYRWKYWYEVDGNKYYCTDEDHNKDKPSNGVDYHRTILVAKDDPSVCLVRNNEDEVTSSVKFQTKTLPLATAIILGISLIIKNLTGLLCKIRKKP